MLIIAALFPYEYHKKPEQFILLAKISWHDSNGHEVDAILTLRGGAWAAFAIKLNPAAVDEAAKSLLRFAKKIDHAQHGEPLALGVITSAGYAGQRPDGVHVIPIGTLGP